MTKYVFMQGLVALVTLALALGGNATVPQSAPTADQYADLVLRFSPGPGTAPPNDEPSAALGGPEEGGGGAASCGSGHVVSLGKGGELIVAFVDRWAADGPGIDLTVWGGERAFADVAVSFDGARFVELGLVHQTGGFDISGTGLALVRYVKVTDANAPTDSPGPGCAGYDIDAVEAAHPVPPGVGRDKENVHPATWPMLGGAPSRAGSSPHRPESPEWALRCAFPTGSRVFDAPVISHDGSMVFGNEAGWVYRLDRDCRTVWSTRVAGPVLSPAVAGDGTVVVPSGDGTVYAFAPDGALRWTFRTGARVRQPAIVPPGTVYVASDDGILYALDLDGKELWRYVAGGLLSWPAVAHDGTAYVAPAGGRVHAVGPDGRARWTAATGCTGLDPWCEHRPAVGEDGTVYVGADDGLVYAFAREGALLWTYDTGLLNSEPGLALGPGGRVYIGSHTGRVVALDSDGTEVWSYSAPGALGAPVLGGTRWVVAGDSSGRLTVLDRHGHERFTFPADGFIRWGASIHRDGSLAFSTYGGTVYSLRVA